MEIEPYYWAGYQIASNEKKRAFRTANWIGGALLAGQILAVAVASLARQLLRFLGHLTKTGAMIHYVDNELYYVVASIAMFVPMLALAAVFDHRRLSDVVSFEKHSKKLGFFLVLICLGFFLAGNVLTNIVFFTLSELGHPPFMPEAFQPDTPFELAVVLLSSACIPALTEEFAFRGVILGLLKPYGNSIAVVISAVLFGLMHGNLIQMPFAFVGGLALGYATVRTGSMWPAVIAHFLNNAISCLMTYLLHVVPPHLSGIVSALAYLLYFGLLVAAGVVGLVMVRRINRKESFSLSHSENFYSTAGQRLVRICCAPAIVLFVLYCVYNALQYIV